MRTPPIAPAAVAFLLCLGACQPRLSGRTVSRVIPEAVDTTRVLPQDLDSTSGQEPGEYGFQTTWMPLEGLVVLEERPGKSTEPKLLFQTTPFLTPLMAIDADRDGSPEFYLGEFPTRRLVVRKFGEAYRDRRKLELRLQRLRLLNRLPITS